MRIRKRLDQVGREIALPQIRGAFGTYSQMQEASIQACVNGCPRSAWIAQASFPVCFH